MAVPRQSRIVDGWALGKEKCKKLKLRARATDFQHFKEKQQKDPSRALQLVANLNIASLYNFPTAILLHMSPLREDLGSVVGQALEGASGEARNTSKERSNKNSPGLQIVS